MKKDFVDKFAALITAAFGLVAALAWNDTIKALFAQVFGEKSTLVAMLVYAVMVTVIAVVVTMWIAKLSEKATE